ncbi:MAG: sigma-70 family RNA polymerase sigma factor [Clostridia bacterium]|nr:sigma-70 family RNA polymerase sigma factor [Clostridia bacterium]
MSNEELVKEIQQGNTGAKNELWERVYKLAYIFCRPYQAYAAEQYMDMDDLMHAAWFGVERAIKAYNPEKEYAFTTYLRYYVRNVIREVLGLRGKPLPLISSLDETIDEDGDICRLDTIEDETATDAFDAIEDEQAAAWIWSRVERLPAGERDAILLYYRDNISLSEQGRRNGCSHQAIAERRESGLNMLRKDRELSRYYNELVYQTLNISVGTFKRIWTSSTELAVLKAEQHGLISCKKPENPAT